MQYTDYFSYKVYIFFAVELRLKFLLSDLGVIVVMTVGYPELSQELSHQAQTSTCQIT